MSIDEHLIVYFVHRFDKGNLVRYYKGLTGTKE